MTRDEIHDADLLELRKIAVLKAMTEAWAARPSVLTVDMQTGDIAVSRPPSLKEAP